MEKNIYNSKRIKIYSLGSTTPKIKPTTTNKPTTKKPTTKKPTTKKPTTTIKPTTTPPCDSYNWCGLKDLKEQLIIKEETKGKIQSRIDQDYYEQDIKKAQADFNEISKKVENNDIQYEDEFNKMQQNQKLLASPHCFRNNVNRAGQKACEKDLEETIDFHSKKVDNLFDKGQKLRGERRQAKQKLNSAKNREIKDLNEIINCQKTINAIKIRIKGIQDSCKNIYPKPICP